MDLFHQPRPIKRTEGQKLGYVFMHTNIWRHSGTTLTMENNVINEIVPNYYNWIIKNLQELKTKTYYWDKINMQLKHTIFNNLVSYMVTYNDRKQHTGNIQRTQGAFGVS